MRLSWIFALVLAIPGLQGVIGTEQHAPTRLDEVGCVVRNIASHCRLSSNNESDLDVWAALMVHNEDRKTMCATDEIFRVMWRNQHPPDCRTAKFLVLDQPSPNLGLTGIAVDAHNFANALGVALSLGRVLIRQGAPLDRHLPSFDTDVFEAWSNCTIEDAFAQLGAEPTLNITAASLDQQILWSEAEDNLLLEAANSIGAHGQWSRIQQMHFPHRTPATLLQRYRSIVRLASLHRHSPLLHDHVHRMDSSEHEDHSLSSSVPSTRVRPPPSVGMRHSSHAHLMDGDDSVRDLSMHSSVFTVPAISASMLRLQHSTGTVHIDEEVFAASIYGRLNANVSAKQLLQEAPLVVLSHAALREVGRDHRFAVRQMVSLRNALCSDTATSQQTSVQLQTWFRAMATSYILRPAVSTVQQLSTQSSSVSSAPSCMAVVAPVRGTQKQLKHWFVRVRRAVDQLLLDAQSTQEPSSSRPGLLLYIAGDGAVHDTLAVPMQQWLESHVAGWNLTATWSVLSSTAMLDQLAQIRDMMRCSTVLCASSLHMCRLLQELRVVTSDTSAVWVDLHPQPPLCPDYDNSLCRMTAADVLALDLSVFGNHHRG